MSGAQEILLRELCKHPRKGMRFPWNGKNWRTWNALVNRSLAYWDDPSDAYWLRPTKAGLAEAKKGELYT